MISVGRNEKTAKRYSVYVRRRRGSYRKSNKSDSETYEGRAGVVDAVFYNEKRETVIIYVSSSNKLKLF
jgi:hypothetical protein